MKVGSAYRDLETKVAAWAAGQPWLHLAVVVGSRARINPPADEWSDLDLVFFTSRPEHYASSPDWLQQFGPVWFAYLDRGEQDSEWQVVYEGGLKVDYFLYPVPAPSSPVDPLALLAAFPYPDVIRRGVRRLGEPQPLVEPGSKAGFTPPGAQAYDELVRSALLAAARTARLAARGELWQAQRDLHCNLHSKLLTLIEWHANRRPEQPADTWYHGRRIASWADPEVSNALPGLFAGYNAGELQQAVLAALALIDRLGREVALAFHYNYPDQEAAALGGWIRGLGGDNP